MNMDIGCHTNQNKYIIPLRLYNILETTRGPQGPEGTFACPGTCFGEYIYWNGKDWVIGNSNITLGCGAGEVNQGLYAVALGQDAGHINQGSNSVAIGNQSGYTGQGIYSIAIGFQAGLTAQNTNSIILNATGEPLNAGTTGFFVAPIRGFTGFNDSTLCEAGASGYYFMMYNPNDTKEVIYYDSSGQTLVPCGDIYSQYLYWDPGFNAWRVGGSSIHIGNNAGLNNQSVNSIAIGDGSGRTNQAESSIAIGVQAGFTGQGQYALAFGYQAGMTGQHDRTIVLNATGFPLGTTATDRFYVKPIREQVQNFLLNYDYLSGEITYASTPQRSFAYFGQSANPFPANPNSFTIGVERVNLIPLNSKIYGTDDLDNGNGSYVYCTYTGTTDKYFKFVFRANIKSSIPVIFSQYIITIQMYDLLGNEFKRCTGTTEYDINTSSQPSPPQPMIFFQAIQKLQPNQGFELYLNIQKVSGGDASFQFANDTALTDSTFYESYTLSVTEV